MSLPTLSRTWQIFANNVVLASGDARQDQQLLLKGIVDVLRAADSAAPAVLGSSDGTTASAVDGVYRWTAASKVVFAPVGAAHSWIVLALTGLGDNVQLCIDCATGGGPTDTFLQLWVSWADGFTGGSTTHRPTAGDELMCSDTTVSAGFIHWLATGFADIDRSYHVWLSTDGSGIRVAVYAAGAVDSWWQIDRAINQVTNWGTPFAVGVLGDEPTFANLCRPDGPLWSLGLGQPMRLGLTSEACGGFAVGELMTSVNGISGNFPISTCGLFSATMASIDGSPVSLLGRHGKVADLFFGSTTPTDGVTYPGDASRQFIQIGDLVMPWDGSA